MSLSLPIKFEEACVGSFLSLALFNQILKRICWKDMSSGFVHSVLRKNAPKDIQLAYVQFDFRKNTLLRCEIWRFTISIEE